MPSNFEKRLAKIEEALARKAKEEEFAKCKCRDPNVVLRPRLGVGIVSELRAELDLTCPVHPVRRLSRVLWFVRIGVDGKRIPDPKMDPILEEYDRRRGAQFKNSLEADAKDV